MSNQQYIDYMNTVKTSNSVEITSLQQTMTSIDQTITQFQQNITALQQQKTDCQTKIDTYTADNAMIDTIIGFIPPTA